MNEPQSLQDLTDGRLSQLKMLAEKQGWDEIKYDVISEQQTRMATKEQ